MPHYDLLISGGHVVTFDPEIGDLPQLLASLTVDSRASFIRKSEHLSYGPLPANGARVTVGGFAAVGGLKETSNLVEPRPRISRVEGVRLTVRGGHR